MTGGDDARLDRVDLGDLTMALSDHSYDHWWWLDPATGGVHLRSEWGDDDDDVDPERVSYRDLEDFASSVREPRARELLLRAIEGRGAFRRFKDTLFEFPDLREALGEVMDPDAVASEAAGGLRRIYGDRLRRVRLFGSWVRGDADEHA